MIDWNPRANDLFVRAAALEGPNERQHFLDEQCGGDTALRQQVEALLLAGQQIGSFLDRPAALAPTAPFIEEGPGTVIGPYKLLQQIGEGGMGTVFLAEQPEPVQRKVALKVLKPGMDSALVIARFEAERQALALMDHPNIARILDAGTVGSEPRPVGSEPRPPGSGPAAPLPDGRGSEGRPYFVMELVKGTPITEFCDQNRLTPRERLELFIPVCQAIQHAHQKGIIHRDIKPSNVLVTLYDGKPVPKVIDFGIAKATEQRLTEKTLFTQHGQIVGTFEYMSPEQATLDSLDVDTRSDIYSLGVLLYELLTGTTPLDKERLRQAALGEILRLIREEEPPRPSSRLSESRGALVAASMQRHTDADKLLGMVTGELDWIVMKSLDKDRTHRYATAAGLALDVEHYLKDEQVEACPPTVGYRVRKFARKHKTAFAMASMAAALLLFGIAATSWQAVRATQAEGKALIELGNAEKARQGEAEQRVIAAAAAAEAQRSAKEEIAARKLADKERLKALFEKQQADLARKQAQENENKAEWRLYAANIAAAQREWETDNVSLVYHYLNQCHRDFRGWEHDYLYTLVNQHQQTLPGPIGDTFSHLAFSADDKRLAAAGRGPWAASPITPKGIPATQGQVWDLGTGKKVLTLEDAWRCVAFSPDGKRLAGGWYEVKIEGFQVDYDGRVKVWDAASGKEIFSLKGHTGVIRSVAFSPDGKRLASTSSDGTVKLWDMASGKEVRSLTPSGTREFKNFKLPGVVTEVAFSPDGKQLATAGESVKVWDVASGKELMTLKGLDIVRVAFSPDGKRLAGASGQGTVKVWELTGGQEVLTFKVPTGSLAFSHDGKRLASASGQGTVKVWELTGGQEVYTLKGPMGPPAFSHDGKRLASMSSDGVKVWDLASSRDCLTLKGHKNAARGLAFSPDGKRLASASNDHTLKLWDVADGREIRTFMGHTDLVTSVAFSPNGKQLASSSWDKTVKLWDAASGAEIRTLQGHTNQGGRVAFSPDGNFLAIAENNTFKGAVNSVRVWELASGKEVLTIKNTGSSLAFSSDGKNLATSYREGVVKVLDASSGREIMTGKGHTGPILSVCFSPNGKRLASASRDMTVKVWDVANGQELMTLRGHTHQVMSVAFSPDGKRLASGSVDNTVKFWDAASGQEVLTLKGHTSSVGYVTFSPDGKRLASASSDFTIKIWDASKSMKEVIQK